MGRLSSERALFPTPVSMTSVAIVLIGRLGGGGGGGGLDASAARLIAASSLCNFFFVFWHKIAVVVAYAKLWFKFLVVFSSACCFLP